MTDRVLSATDSDTLPDGSPAARQAVSASMSLAVVLFTAIVVARAITGHLNRGLHAPGVFAAYFALTLVAVGAVWYRVGSWKRLLLAPDAHRPDGLLAVAIVCPVLTAMVLGRHLSAGLLLLLWSLTALLTAASFWWLYRRGAGTPQTPEPCPREVSSTTMAPVVQASPVDATESFTQRWTRREGELGDELEGTLKIFFAAGQRTATADIPIVPAMAGIPDVDCEPLQPGDGDLQVIVRTTHTYGVRLELQRPAERTAEEEIEVAVLIHAERAAED